MPRAFVERWPELRVLADSLDATANDIAGGMAEFVSSVVAVPRVLADGSFTPKSEAPYTAKIREHVEHRTRGHERLVREVGSWLQAQGATVTTPHPIDLKITDPIEVIIEAKTVGTRDPLYAVREALGQVHEYRYFIGPYDAALAILLEAVPPDELVRYAEEYHEVALLWWDAGSLSAGSRGALLLGAAASSRLDPPH